MTGRFTLDDYDRAADCIRARAGAWASGAGSGRPVGLVLGSGLNQVAQAIEGAVGIPFGAIPRFPASTVEGHEGRLILGKLAAQNVVAMQGRIHFYEGYDADEITFPIRVMSRLGVETLILTNAAGGLHPDFRAGDLMLITDHVNFVGMGGSNPLRGPNLAEFGNRFPSMTDPYARRLRRLAVETADDLKIPLQRGIYAYVAGPSFETPAEVRFLRLIGADAVGMSTVPEATVAGHAGMQALGISTITNVAVDRLDSDLETSHEEVMQTGRMGRPPAVAAADRHPRAHVTPTLYGMGGRRAPAAPLLRGPPAFPSSRLRRRLFPRCCPRS